MPDWVKEKTKEIADQISRILGTKVITKETSTGAIQFRGPLIFAYAYSRENGAFMLVETKKEWADKADVTSVVSYK